MDRSIEILQILRHGMESMLQSVDSTSVRYTRIFNFDERRVALRMEVSDHGQAFIPMGRIDVLEIATNNGRVTCSCTLTEIQTGNSQRVILRLKNTEERANECEKVFGFEDLNGYDTTRLYAYLAERYASFWFKKYTNYKEQPWLFIND